MHAQHGNLSHSRIQKARVPFPMELYIPIVCGWVNLSEELTRIDVMSWFMIALECGLGWVASCVEGLGGMRLG